MVSVISVVLLLLLFVGIIVAQAPSAPVWPVQWHAEVIVGDAGFTPDSTSLSVLYSGGYFYNYSSGASPVISYYLTHRYSSRVEKEVIFSNGGDGLTPYVIDYSSGSCSSPILVKDRWQVFAPNFVSSKGFKFMSYDFLLATEGDSYIETTHWSYSTVFGTSVDYWHATGTNSPFRLIWTPLTGNPVVVQFSNFVSSFPDIPNPEFYFQLPSTCSSSSISKDLNSIKFNSIENSNPNANANSFIRATANPWPNQWNAAARFTGNVFGTQSLLPTSVSFSLSGHFYYDFANSRECNVWTDLSTNSRSKTLIVNGTFHIVDLSTGSCVIVPISPVNGPLKPNWPETLPSVGSQWLYVKNTRAFIASQHYRMDVLQIGERYAFNYWQSSNGTPRLFQGPVQGVAPYGTSLMEWEGVELGLQGVDIDNVFSIPKVCKKIGIEQLSLQKEWMVHLAKYYQMRQYI